MKPGTTTIRTAAGSGRFRRAVALVWALVLAGPAGAWAASLGNLTVHSAVGESLRAEIELNDVSPREQASLLAVAASPDALARAGIAQAAPIAPAELVVSIESIAGKQVVRLASRTAMSKPFVDLAIELSWGSGRVLREYSFLLAPPESGPSVQVVEGGRVHGDAAPAVAFSAGAASQADAAGIVVRPGDTLGDIVRRVKPQALLSEQALVAIYRANPAAFFGSIHQLRAGATLKVPGRDAMATVSPSEARREVSDQNRRFSEYRSRLSQSPQTVATGSAGTSAQGTVTAGGAAPAAGTQGDRLTLSKGVPDGSTSPGAAPSRSAAQAEDRVAREAALREQQSRVAELEKNVSDLQQLLELKNRQLAETERRLQAQGEAADTDTPAAKSVEASAKAEDASSSDSNSTSYIAALITAVIIAFGCAGYLVYVMRRRRAPGRAALTPSAAGAATTAASSEAPDEPPEPVFAADLDEASGDTQAAAADPVAEADVYIAYGRHAQAEDILRRELAVNPDRQDVRAKLLDLYFERRDAHAYGALAAEMYESTQGANDEWPKVAEQGLALDPDNPLYQGEDADVGLAADDSSANAPRVSGASVVPAASSSAALDALAELDIDLDLDTHIGGAAPQGQFRSDLERAINGRFDLPSLDIPVLTGDNASAAPQTTSARSAADAAARTAQPAGGAAHGTAWQEAAAKLDLAGAYEEIGDLEGARDLLDEVLRTGDEPQRRAARDMIARLADASSTGSKGS